MSSLLDAALGYAARGWPVIPLHHPVSAGPKTGDDRARCSCGRARCESQGKHPRTSHGLDDATTGPATIRKWWSRWPDANIGLLTGVAFDVLDLDEGGHVGLDALDDAATDDGPRGGPMVLTGNGLHWYMAPTGLGNRARFLPGCDWRGIGGYVVAAPSVHPSGHVYAWDPTYGPDTTIPEVPGWLRRLLQPPSAQPRPAPSSGAGSAYGRKAMDAELGRLALVAEGSRNAELVRAAFRLGQLVAGGELDRVDVARALLTVAQRIGLTDAESIATIASGMNHALGSPRSAPEARR